MNDPQIRMQQWGGNLRTNAMNLESDLMGLTRPLTRDCDKNNFQKQAVSSDKMVYPECNPLTDESRVTNPAWWYRDLEQNHRYILPLNPQENTCIPFQNNLSTRILEKDHFIADAPCIESNNNNVLAASAFTGFGSNVNVNNCSTLQTCGTIKK